MPDQEPVDTERTVVTTYVPAYQKTAWEDHAEEFDMSLSEFVRTMVQAGRRGFGDATQETRPEEPHSETVNPGVDAREQVIQTLQSEGQLTGDQIMKAIVDPLRNDVVEAVEDLKAAGKIERPGISDEFELVEE